MLLSIQVVHVLRLTDSYTVGRSFEQLRTSSIKIDILPFVIYFGDKTLEIILQLELSLLVDCHLMFVLAREVGYFNLRLTCCFLALPCSFDQ